jgi:peroxiredoxin
MKKILCMTALGFFLACGSSTSTTTNDKALPVNVDKPTEKAPAAALMETAPDFSLKDSEGKEQSLSGYKGKYVVLEWVNYGCPFVKRQYDLGAMQKAQKEMTDKGVIWLAISTSAPGKQGYLEGTELTDQIKAHNGAQTAYLLDSEGKVGKLYSAKTTPHMFVINPEGKIIYQGAIDDQASANVEQPAGKNYVTTAIEESLAGKPVTNSNTPPYGCGVKYM